MVTVVQLVEHQVVILAVAGSSPVGHPARARLEDFPRAWPFLVPAEDRFRGYNGRVTENTRGPSFHADRIEDTAHHDQLITILDAQAELPGVRRLRRWVMAALAVAPGDRALDIGSGTGSEVLEFARLAGPTGEAVGLDPNPAMLAEAERRAAAQGITARFVHGDVYALPFEDDSFDVIRCERVYQHLDHPERATTEIARVLRPGGRVALVDSDWSTGIVHPGDPEVVRALMEFSTGQAPNRNSGRRLRGLLTAAHLQVDEIGADAVVWEPSIIDTMLAMGTGQAVSAGKITAAQRDQLTVDLEQGVAVGDYHFSVTMFAVLAHRPPRP